MLEPLGGHCLGGLAAARFVYTSLSTEGVCRKMPRDRCSNGGRSTSGKKKLSSGFWLQKIYQGAPLRTWHVGVVAEPFHHQSIISSYGRHLAQVL